MKVSQRNILDLFSDGEWHQAGEVARDLGVTRQTSHRHLRKLVNTGFLIVEGAGRGTRYRQRVDRLTLRYPTEGLEEHKVWNNLEHKSRMVASLPDVPATALNYALTELVNNVIDHSGAAELTINLKDDAPRITLEVIDRGIGIFEHIRGKLDLASELEALVELSKGKTTTMPSRHTGEGIFFASKVASVFEIRSGKQRWLIDNIRRDMAVGEIDPPKQGTVVRVEIDRTNPIDLAEVFQQFTDDFVFSKTRTMIRLVEIGQTFVSRSEAKRLLLGLEKFNEVVLDFEGVSMVGQGFLDEVFRVWALAHQGTTLVPVEMNDAVAFMVERAIRRAQED